MWKQNTTSKKTPSDRSILEEGRDRTGMVAALSRMRTQQPNANDIVWRFIEEDGPVRGEKLAHHQPQQPPKPTAFIRLISSVFNEERTNI